MVHTQEELLDWFEKEISDPQSRADIIDIEPGLKVCDAFRLQLAYAKRQVAKGERLIGYKAAHTSLAIQMEEHAGVSIGGLLQRFAYDEAKPFTVPPEIETFVEPEISVLLERDLVGPGVTAIDAYRAVAAVFPSIEIVTPPRGERKRSRQMSVARSKTEGGFVFGGPLTRLSGIDLRLEGVVVSVNGVPKRSAAGVEAMGNPLNVVASVANELAEFGECLRAGMVLMTGSLTNNISVSPGDQVQAEFTRIGSVRARFTAGK
jgi:2-keto-4-pentenoate hydratase